MGTEVSEKVLSLLRQHKDATDNIRIWKKCADEIAEKIRRVEQKEDTAYTRSMRGTV